MGGKKRPPAPTLESRQNQLISLAVDNAERQIRKGTASSQIITHYLKLATVKAEIEREILTNTRDLLKAKTDSIKSAINVEQLYKDALRAMRSYQGHTEEGDEYETDDR